MTNLEQSLRVFLQELLEEETYEWETRSHVGHLTSEGYACKRVAKTIARIRICLDHILRNNEEA